MTCKGLSILAFLTSFLILSLCRAKVDKSEHIDIIIGVLNPTNTFHEKKADILKKNIERQYDNNIELLKPLVLFLQELNIQGAWTILPLMSTLVEKCVTCRAVVFCNENVEVNLELLTKEFEKLDFTQDIFGGRALQDSSATIIHHYNFKNDISFEYPDINSGFFLSIALLKKLAERFDRSRAKIDFSIDAYYEFSQFVHDDGKCVNLTSYDFVCGFGDASPNCALRSGLQNPSCKEFKTRNEDVIVAVKTCEKFHESRSLFVGSLQIQCKFSKDMSVVVPVLIDTWGQSVKNIFFFSDIRNDSIPTQDVGIPNTEQGHCKKFFLILEKCHNLIRSHGYKWLLVVDDDTLVSFRRLLDLLSCYNPEDLIYLGERYGYGVVSGHGYDYVTLGGGMALSRKGLEKIVESKSCRCAKDDAPDDMTLGMCLFHLDLPITHSPLFHQARPSDYTNAYLESQLPISFHRYWENDPHEVYRKWLKVNISDNHGNEPRSDL